jgi:hypothetical protein
MRKKPREINGRGDRIRTCDIYVPNGRVRRIGLQIKRLQIVNVQNFPSSDPPNFLG